MRGIQRIQSFTNIISKSLFKSQNRKFNVGKSSDYKVISSFDEAVKDIKSGDSIGVGGFGLCGVPENLISALLRRKDLKDITLISDNGGTPDFSVGLLLREQKVKKIISSFIGNNPLFERMYLKGELELELIPQGTLAEKLRCGGAGIPAFYTPTGKDTLVEQGGIPLKYRADGSVEKFSSKKETKIYNGKKFLEEEAIRTDFSIIKGYKGDTKGNIIFRRTARNFNIDMACAGKVCIAEVEELVEPGQLKPDEIHLPSVYVHRILKGEKYEKRLERLMLRDAQNGKDDLAWRSKIAYRAAQELKDGDDINLGIGIPTLVPNYIPKGVTVNIHAENGMLGVGPYPATAQEADPDLINPGKESISEQIGCSYFKSSDSFSIIRGNHLGLTMLGALEVSATGDLANWLVPGKVVKGMGGAMDLVGSGTKVVVLMKHSIKGKPKIIEKCTLPLTGKGVVNKVITDLCVFDFDKEKNIILSEIFEGVTVDQVKAETGCKFRVADDLKTIRF